MNNLVVEVERTLDYPTELGHDAPGRFLQTIRRMVREVKDSDPKLAGCELYDIGFKRNGEQVYLRFYFKRPRSD